MYTVIRISHWRGRVAFGLALAALLSTPLGTGAQAAAEAAPNMA